MNAPIPLSPERLRHLYDVYKRQDPWPEWRQRQLDCLKQFTNLTVTELLTPEAQEKLWKARGIGGVGPGESINTEAAQADETITAPISELKTRTWPSETPKRAQAIQDAYEGILARVAVHTPNRQPKSKLARVFSALLPEHTHTAFTWKFNRKVSRLVVGPEKYKTIESAVLVRARLRQLLGAKEDLEESVRRVTFCWWLQSHEEEILRGEDPVDEEGTEHEEPPAPLALEPFSKQIRGIPAVGGYVDTYRAVVNATRGGATQDDAVEALRSDFGLENLKPKSCRQVFGRVKRLGFLTDRGGLWHPSEDGEELVESDPPDILVERFLKWHFGTAHLLRFIHEKPLTRKEVELALREVYPNWTKGFMAGGMIQWARSLGLAEQRGDGKWEITDYGAAWAERLPKELPAPPSRPSGPLGPDKPGLKPEPETTRPWPSLDQILAAFKSDTDLKEFVFEEIQLRALHTAWHCHPRKRFLILSGLSGTGKTAVLLHYARVYAALLDLDPEDHRTVVPVSPDWRDPSGVLGYFNALHADPKYEVEPALRLILRAVENPELPFFLILDEMNLARVERYFAPFLSAMETGDHLHLHASEDEVTQVPPSVPWPENLFVGGTVNMDETTHPFSDKVLDRAFTLEFWSVDLETFFSRRDLRNQKAEKVLLEIHALLRPIRRHFGYRTAGEVLDFLAQGGNELLDQAVFAKILPRLRGEDTGALRDALKSLREFCGAEGLTACQEKLGAMIVRLEDHGVTRFWS